MPYNLNGHRTWASGTCRISLTGPGWPSAWLAAARSAIAHWNNVNPQFQFIEDPHAANHLTCFNLGGNGSLALTQTHPASTKSPLSHAVVLVNTHYEFDPAHPLLPHVDTSGPHDLETIVLHELGHVLHLAHDNSPAAQTIMRATFVPKQRCQIHADDIAGSRHLYP